MAQAVFITGGTGNIGGKLITHILQEDRDTRIFALVRGDSDADARERLFRVLALLAPGIDPDRTGGRITVLAGDVTREGLGLSAPVRGRLAQEVTHVIHSAAATKFDLPLEFMRKVNVAGTLNVMAFARQIQEAGTLRGVAYISTAYICGGRGGVIREDAPDPAPRLSNTYEQTKWEAERCVRGLTPLLPVTIFRPTIVVGDSATGRTTVFNVLYTPLKWMYRGKLRALPGSPDCPLDVVPVDFVAAAIHHIFLTTGEGTGGTFHLAAGKQNSTTVGEIIDLAGEYFHRAKPESLPVRMRYLPPWAARALSFLPPGRIGKSLQRIRIFEPYIRRARLFDNSRTMEALRGSGISPPRLADYFPNLLAFCFAARWGNDLADAS